MPGKLTVTVTPAIATGPVPPSEFEGFPPEAPLDRDRIVFEGWSWEDGGATPSFEWRRAGLMLGGRCILTERRAGPAAMTVIEQAPVDACRDG